jgi:proline-specific peptidase
MEQYPPASKSGKVPFKPSGTTKECHTAYWIFGELTSSTIPLIGVHGGPGYPHQCMLPLAHLARAPYNKVVILYDQVGCGESTHLPETKGDYDFWSIDLFVLELHNLIGQLGLSQYDVLGHSNGGVISGSFALTQPKGLRKLCLFATTPDFELRVSEARRMRRELLPPNVVETLEKGERDGNVTSPEYRAASEEFDKIAFFRTDGPMPEAMNACVESASKDDTVPWTFGGDSVYIPGGRMEGWSIVDRLPEITEQTVPGGVLLLMGRWCVNNAKTYKLFEDGIKAKTKMVVFENSSHMPMFEEEEHFLEVVGSFFGEK